MTEPSWWAEWSLASRPRPSLHNAHPAIARRAGEGSGAGQRREVPSNGERSRVDSLIVVGVSDRLCSGCLDEGVMTHLWKVAAGLMRALVCPHCDGQADNA